MVGTLADKVSGLLDPRFRLTVWLPTLVFALALGAIAVLGVGWRESVDWWRSAGTEGQIALALCAFAAVTLAAFLLSAQLMGFLRFFEGYWDDLPLGAALARRRKAHYRAKLSELLAADDAATVYYRYPPLLEKVMPTRFGNILRASEMHPNLRYGLDAVIAWPRLYTLLPASFTDSFAAAKSQMDLMAVWTLLSVAFALLGGGLAAALLPPGAALACVWGAALSAALGYHALVRNATPYGELVKSAFDVHRKAMLDAIGWTAASSLDAERDQWTAIIELWYLVEPTDPAALGYSAAQPAAAVADPIGDDPPGGDPPDPPAPGNPPDEPVWKHLGLWIALAAILLGVLLAGGAAVRDEPEATPRIAVATRALPAYHQIVRSDLEHQDRRKAPRGAFTSLDAPVGRYTLHQVAKGRPALRADLGPRLARQRLRETATIELGPHSARFPATLRRGDEVDVFAHPRAGSSAGAFELDDTLVLDVRSSGALVLAVPAGRQAALASAVASGVVVVVGEPG